MFKSLLGNAHLGYTCLCLTRQQLVAKTGSPSQGLLRGLRTSPTASILSKEVKAKKSQIKSSQEFKVDTGSLSVKDGSENDDIQGRDHRGILIPDLNTNSMLISGVRFDEIPILHLKCSPNNTIALLTDFTGKTHLGRTSCGQEGFRNAKKSSTVAAQATGMSIGYMAKKNGVEYVRIAVKGIGSGRLPAIKGVEMAGIKIVSITDRTPIFSNGPRPRKARRL